MDNYHPMKFIADLHIHSHFSRATSRNLDPENLCLWAKKKGITLLGTGDFTHPGWIAELREKLVDAENGLYRLKPGLEKAVEKDVPESCRRPMRFLLSGEISCIYKRGGKTRKVHHLILMPDFESAERLNRALDRVGNIRSDGRPILGLDSRDLLEMTLDASERAFFIPAHIWTPWFSVFGSKSGFDALEECFGDLTKHIHALETGLSSDPPMNRMLSSLDDYLLVSNSDAHSPSKLGREANIFDTGLDYNEITYAMTNKTGFLGTIEFYPEEGKYHLDGHRKCGVRLRPEETRDYKGLCPSCGKAITVGVLHRVAELSDRDEPELSKEFHSLIPLPEILSEILECGPATKKVSSVYEGLLALLGPELEILMDAPLKDIRDGGDIFLATAIERMRRNLVIKQGGYDGEYGVIRLFHESEKAELAGQRSLFQITRKETATKRVPLTKGTGTDVAAEPVKRRQAAVPDPILDLLNPPQREAVLHEGGHLLIVAGPGTGKTMTLTHRIAHMIRSGLAAPEEILALTFTNKAAGEMRRRINKLLPVGQSGEIYVTTFHGFCLDLLRNEADKLDIPSDFILCSAQDSSLLAEQAVSESGKGRRLATRLLKELPSMKMLDLTGLGNHEEYQELLPLFRRYQENLMELGMLDLDDLQTETLRLFLDNPEAGLEYSGRFKRVFVDEYQDTNPLQVALLKKIIMQGINEICAIGDPDQAIYGFRGADVENFYRFPEDFPGSREIRLSSNYRSTEVILRGAADLMERERSLEGTRGRGGSIRLGSCRTPAEEAEMIVEQVEKLMGGTTYFSLDSGRVSSHEDGGNFGFGDIAVLFRLNAQGDAFEEAFSRAGIPFIRSGEKALTSQYPVDVIWRFLRALCYPGREYYLKAYTDLVEKNGLNGKEIIQGTKLADDLEGLIDHAILIHGLDPVDDNAIRLIGRVKELAGSSGEDLKSFLDSLSLDRGIDHSVLSGDRVAIMSLHAAKGLEWPVVFITGCEEALIPCSLFGDNDAAEEKRLLYVGMTRACRHLILSHSGRRSINGRMLDMGPSPFLDLISRDLLAPLERAKWRRKGKSHRQLELF